jgi:hypothetical protein
MTDGIHHVDYHIYYILILIFMIYNVVIYYNLSFDTHEADVIIKDV